MSIYSSQSLTLVLGPTNTGKTHLALERMTGYASGMIGFPLRLLARENYDRLVRKLGVGKVGLLTGEPEYLDPLKGEAPEGWLVTGYPWYDIKTPAHQAFLDAYQARFNDYPRIGSLVGYNTMQAIAAMLNKAGSTDTEAMGEAMKGLSFDAPSGPITFRAIDHQSTMGAYVGWTKLEGGKGKMINWAYENGADYLPSDDVVRQLRPGS